ncbi:MAG: PepSY-associated TM helix domain-containing protein [Pseudomonadota bacterium]
MSPSTIKTFLSVHTWTGLGAGLALFIAFYTGAMTVFFHELEHWDAYTDSVPAAQTQAQAQTLIDQVMLTDPGAAPSFRLYPSSADHPGNSVYWFERQEDGNFETYQYRMDEQGALNTTEDTAHLASFIYRLHYTAGLPSSFGLYVLGIVCLIYGIALISGIIVFLPNWLKDLFVVREGKNKKRFWLDAHNVVGVISLPWHFMFAWSSAVLAIGVFFLAPFQYVVFEDDMIEKFGDELGRVIVNEPAGETASMLDVTEIIQIAKEQTPNMEITQLRFSNYHDANATVSVYGESHVGTLTPFTNITMNASSGEIINVSNPAESSAGATFYNGLIALHFVSFGGFTAKWVYFFLGLAGAFLFFSGNLLWIETRRKRRQFEQPGTAVFLARLTTGVCIGCMAGVSAAFLASRGFAELANRPDLTELAYYIVFFVSVGWAFLRPVAAGARDLLYACAVLTTFVPVFDVLFVSGSIWQHAFTAHLPLVIVDILAILGAWAFWAMARRVEARAQAGDPNSVWAAPAQAASVDMSAEVQASR